MRRISKYELVCEKVQTHCVKEDKDIWVRVDTSDRVARVMNELGCEKWLVEKFVVFAIDNKLRIVGMSEVSSGSLESTMAHPREIFQTLLQIPKCAAFIVSHNHPSGDPSPSSLDIQLTKDLIECSKVMGIRMIDHVIMGEDKHVSMRMEMEGDWK